MISNEEKIAKIAEAKGLAKLLSIDLTIKIFGITIIEYHFPPQNS